MLNKILIVDDSASDRMLIKNMLKGYETLTACDGMEAKRILDADGDIRFVILDLNMPNMDGFELLSLHKADARYKRLRILILTNYDEPENEIKGLKLGAVDYIRKPVNMESLRTRMEMHINMLQIQHLYEQKLYEQGMTFDTILQQAPIGIAVSYNMEPLDPDATGIPSINPMFEQITGRAKDEIIRLGWANITHPDDLEEDIKNFQKLKSGEIKSYSMEKRYIKPDGSIVWVNMIVAAIKLTDDDHYDHICLVQDITGRKATESALIESERSKSVLLSHLPGMAYRCNYDRKWTMQFVSAGCYQLTGYHPESLLYNKERSFNSLITPEYREALWKEWERRLKKRLPFNYEYEITTAEGQRKWVLEIGQGIYNEQGEVIALEGIILDISDRKAIVDTLRYNSEHDRWTGLYNRSYLENRLNSDAEKHTAGKRALASINLTAVHSLTATYGFHYTQDLIKQIVDALTVHCTDKCTLYNTYENRFVFYIKDYKDKAELLAFCNAVAETLDSLLAVERIGGGIGVVEIDQYPGRDADELLKNLLIASEKAIELFGKDFGVCFYDAQIEMQIVREQEIKQELGRITSDEHGEGLYLKYQPIVDLESNRVYGFEALARIHSSTLGQISPYEFIPIAEETKLIIPLGKVAIRKAFQFIKRLRQQNAKKRYAI